MLPASVWIAFGLIVTILVGLAVSYLLRIDHLLKGVPSDVQKLSSPRWTAEKLKKTYSELENQPVDWTHKLPAKIERRYIVTGGNGETKIQRRRSAMAMELLRQLILSRPRRWLYCTSASCSRHTSA